MTEIKQPVWFVPIVAPAQCPSWVGLPTKNETKARKQAQRVGQALLKAGIPNGWKIGVGRCFNRRFPTDAGAVFGDYGTLYIPLFGPLPALPNRQVI